MKILFIIGSLNQGGAEYQILALAKLFQENGHKVELFAITDYSFYKPFIKDNNLKYEHLLNNQSVINRVFLTTKKVRKVKPDLIISYLKRTSQVALFAKIFSGVKAKIIIGERTSDIQPKYDQYHFNLMRFANHITVNSISKLNYLNNNFPSLQKKISFFPNIIDIEKYSIPNKKYDKKELIVGFVGRVSKEKNIINLIKAIKHLVDRGENIKLYIYGDARNPTYKTEIENLIFSEKLEDYVFLKGKLTDVNIAYKKIDLLCLISDYEGFSNVISEGLSCGLPIITSNIPENKFLVENNINGFVVNHKDSLSISEGIQKYLDLSVNMKEDMAQQNRKKSKDLFDKGRIYNEYMDLIFTL